MKLHIVLLEPEIPQNTGNIARSCVITGASLHLIKPMKFSISDREVKRAGLDYWNLLDLKVYEDYEEFCSKHEGRKIYYATTKTRRVYSDVNYGEEEEVYVMFGKESKGIPEEVLHENSDTAITIPMRQVEKARSLNLSNACAIVMYEVLKQWGFPGMRKGDL